MQLSMGAGNSYMRPRPDSFTIHTDISAPAQRPYMNRHGQQISPQDYSRLPPGDRRHWQQPEMLLVDSNRPMPFRQGTFDSVHALNPYGFNPVSSQTADVMRPGGSLYVSGQPRNPFAMNENRPHARMPSHHVDPASVGLRYDGRGPMIPQHLEVPQTLTGGRPLNTEYSQTHTYTRPFFDPS